MDLVLIGSGNVATVLGRKMLMAGHQFIQVISRDLGHAEILAKELGCDYTSQLRAIEMGADLYIIAISDSQLMLLGDGLFLGDKLVVHTAGSLSMEVLKKVSSNYGVLYPLQSLRKEIKSIPEIPLLVDANSLENLRKIKDFAATISDQVLQVGDLERQKLHTGAIIVNNFTNHLFTLTEDFCREERIEFHLLLPLMKETVSRLSLFSPSQVQTGPAARNDLVTIAKHLQLLSHSPELKKIYEMMTSSIRNRVGHS